MVQEYLNYLISELKEKYSPSDIHINTIGAIIINSFTQISEEEASNILKFLGGSWQLKYTQQNRTFFIFRNENLEADARNHSLKELLK